MYPYIIYSYFLLMVNMENIKILNTTRNPLYYEKYYKYSLY